jgi:tetratricopeptide (TPR) repeat protein
MIKATKSRPVIAILPVFLLAALVGCVSVEKRYRKGQELESQGRLEEAARRYIAVLAKDPSMEDARRSLADVGARMVNADLAQARADEADGLYESAVSAILRIDSLRDATAQVGIDLFVPEDYGEFRRDMVDAAIASLTRQGEDQEAAGNWPEALRRYEQMLPYPLSSDQRLRIDEARARVLVRWAGQDMETGSFRAAYQHAERALDIDGPDGASGADGLAIQRAALEAGTKTVAVLPFWAERGAENRAPRGTAASLYDTLLYEHMEKPVLFVRSVDRGEIHREMSRLRVRSGDIPVRTAAMVGRALDADFVLVGWLESFLQEDGVPEETARQAPLRRDRSKSAAYTERKYSVRLTGEVIYRIVDPATRQVVAEEKIAARASDTFRRAFFDGDYTTLDLTRDQRALFDRESWLRAEEEFQARLVDELAKKIAANVIERVLRFVR